MFVFFAMSIDFFFGTAHCLCHKISSLYKHHMVHHKYKKERLNAFATFYADLFDAFSMNYSILLAAIIVYYTRTYDIAYMECIYAAGTTHLRYIQNQMNLLYFYEWDFLDMLLGVERIGCFHTEHHQSLNKNFSTYGLLSDKTIETILAPFDGFIPKKKKVKKAA